VIFGLLLVIFNNISVVDKVGLEGLLPLGEVVSLVSQVVQLSFPEGLPVELELLIDGFSVLNLGLKLPEKIDDVRDNVGWRVNSDLCEALNNWAEDLILISKSAHGVQLVADGREPVLKLEERSSTTKVSHEGDGLRDSIDGLDVLGKDDYKFGILPLPVSLTLHHSSIDGEQIINGVNKVLFSKGSKSNSVLYGLNCDVSLVHVVVSLVSGHWDIGAAHRALLGMVGVSFLLLDVQFIC